MTKRNIVVIGLALAGMWAWSAQAQPSDPLPGMGHHHRHMMGGGPGGLIPLLLHATDLTPDQDAQVHQILDADRPAVQPIFSQLQQANTDLASLLLGAQGVQSDAVSAQLTLIAQLQQQLAQHEVATVAAIRAILTPDQLAKALAAKDQMRAWHGDKSHCAASGT